jgi:hypothetical protein
MLGHFVGPIRRGARLVADAAPAHTRSKSAPVEVCAELARLLHVFLDAVDLALKIRSEISGVLSSTSTAAARVRLTGGIRRCEITALRLSDRSIWLVAPLLREGLMIGHRLVELLACSVPRADGRFGKRTACSITSMSRISPSGSSGAWRSVFLSRLQESYRRDLALRVRQFLCGWTYSTGSSMVMMWPCEFSLR